MKKFLRILALAAGLAVASCTAGPPAPYGPTPTPQQLAWQKMEMNMFCHFGPNTFTGRDWGLGTETEDLFSPTDLDCRQWTSTAKAAGFKGIILTAKHHDGFCLWPNPVTTHTVAQSSWRAGKGDVLKDLSEACAADGLKLGVYISPWDRNSPNYGTPAYNDLFVRTLESALGSYGPVFEQWFDGANGEGPGGKKQTYDWPLFNQTVRRMQPDAVIFSDVGPGCRWMGNERGEAGRTNWSRLDIGNFEPGAGAPPRDTLSQGQRNGALWIPAETDVSIRPRWFWRASENGQVKTAAKLLQIYYTSVGRNSVLLLNVPPDTTGRINPLDSARLMELRTVLDDIFKENLARGARAKASATRRGFGTSNLLDEDYDTYWAAPEGTRTASLTFTLPEERTFNRVMLQEYIPLGQRISSFRVDAQVDGTWKEIASETTVGYKRIVLTETVTTRSVRLNITGARACPVLNNFGLYLDRFLPSEEGQGGGL